jgi:BirA family biotin operon repressor/biotin-[acetyl-CoA-carboxylase] ligase
MWNLNSFEVLSSTNTYARDRIARGTAEHGDVIQAKHQTSGRGRFAQRAWTDEAGANLLMTIILKDIPKENVEFLSYITGLAIAQMLRSYLTLWKGMGVHARVRMKWPNDIQIDERKCCGILSEAVWQGDELRGVLIGIGLNVNQERFPEQLRERSTSLAIVTNQKLVVNEIRDQLLVKLGEAYDSYANLSRKELLAKLLPAIREEFNWMHSRPPFDVELLDGSMVRSVRYCGIDEAGAMYVKSKDGKELKLMSGTLHETLTNGSTE